VSAIGVAAFAEKGHEITEGMNEILKLEEIEMLIFAVWTFNNVNILNHLYSPNFVINVNHII
jgi:hypothetical protein